MANLLLKFPNFRYHGKHKLSLSKVWLTPLNWPILKTPYCVQASGTYLLSKLSYSRFCVKNRQIFVTTATRVCLSQISHSLIGLPWKPYCRTKNYDSILYSLQPELGQFKDFTIETMVIFSNFPKNSVKYKISLLWPSKGSSLRRTTSFDVLSVKIHAGISAVGDWKNQKSSKHA